MGRTDRRNPPRIGLRIQRNATATIHLQIHKGGRKDAAVQNDITAQPLFHPDNQTVFNDQGLVRQQPRTVKYLRAGKDVSHVSPHETHGIYSSLEGPL